MDFSTVSASLGVLLAVVTLVGLWAGIRAYYRSDVTQKTIKHLSELAEALEMRVHALEEERDSLHIRIDTLEKENSVLRSLVSGEAKAIEMISLSQQNHTEIMSALVAIQDDLAN